MKFEILDLVKLVVTGEKYIIVATKEKPWQKKSDVFMRSNVFPERDYLILKETTKGNYLGEIDVYENEIESL